MDFFQPRFPTPALKKAEALLRSVARRMLTRSRDSMAFNAPHELQSSISDWVVFAQDFYRVYEVWQGEAAKQFQEPIQCKAACSNCCQHYPMSIEPFEAIYLYSILRHREDFPRILEECFRRVKAYQSRRKALEESTGTWNDELDDKVLHDFFFLGLRCPLLDEKGNCSEHASRPITCRMYFSFSDANYCTPEYLLKPENRSFHLCLPDELEEDLGEIREAFAELEFTESLYENILILNSWEGEGIWH